ncbi:LLM class flavin-dependent oxidoreductase [Modestobacter sp. Leaf380]|uniref:LLM class flavin-dependent oxidoreductase n=1 Tax=Modestobacter sp. Leaf380 TaxID=1736356 RepID=UPI0006FD7FFE|nr:LLM class flavin-dependent oxidoreductase [Modestobacter sp. Leaf380]KQS63657.1 hypothetical protein ASG41_18645 [Modestobacter sp. Leaf380]
MPRTGVAVELEELPIGALVERTRLAEELGMDSAWLVQLPNMRDSASLLAAMAATTDRIGIGAGILPVYTRPPVVMAQTAATVDELSGGRFTLGLGLGHRLTAEWALGVPQGPPLAAMREYLEVVRTLLHDGEVHVDGAHYRGHARYAPPRRDDLPVCLGALNPRMVELAGEAADGLLLWNCTVGYVRDVAVPRLHDSLRRAGRDPDGFPVVVITPAAVSEDLDHDTAWMRDYLQNYARIPNYRAMYEASGLGHDLTGGQVGDDLLHAASVIGADDLVTERVAEFAAAGATEVVVSPMASAHHDAGLWRRTLQAALRA